MGGAETVGQALLCVGMLASGAALLVSWQFYSRTPSLESGALLCFTLGQAYSTATLLLGALLPLRVVYSAEEMLEMLHRSRYLMFDCASLLSVVWVLVFIVRRSQADFGVIGAIVGRLESFATPLLALLGFAHLLAAGLACSDCARYPLSHDNCLGVLYWRPARFTLRMRYPWLAATRLLWAFSICVLLMQGRPWLLLSSGAFHLAYHGHVSRWQYQSWEVFAQPLCGALLSASLLAALDVSVSCRQGLDLSTCLVLTPGGPVPLFGGTSRLRL
eukprot:TRINITY_DN52954_c0_g1_i1.p1 TRINITY_DN52954_c0_g1~~TRINITY_DN52954_c0_g1_i1.p1  ORF type:complete len:274 (-),score=35.98 TRINITY_DN52954_c0_g1_i1:4-825(-)